MYEYMTVIVKGVHKLADALNDMSVEKWRVVPSSITSIGSNICVVMEREVGSFVPPPPPAKIEVVEEVVEEPVVEVGPGVVEETVDSFDEDEDTLKGIFRDAGSKDGGPQE